MRIEDDEPPIKTKHASQEFRDGWERTFGEKDVTEEFVARKFEEQCLRDTSAVFPIDGEGDAIECRLKLYANFEPPPHVASFAVGAAAVEIGWTCPACCGTDTSREVSEIDWEHGWFQCMPRDSDLREDNRLRHNLSDIP